MHTRYKCAPYKVILQLTAMNYIRDLYMNYFGVAKLER